MANVNNAWYLTYDLNTFSHILRWVFLTVMSCNKMARTFLI
uniref:Uncharacterized protein n=1 Tax=Anguilla anguilla TaxID=7936 RepID=A0A0E9SXZ9_ANGAN